MILHDIHGWHMLLQMIHFTFHCEGLEKLNQYQMHIKLLLYLCNRGSHLPRSRLLTKRHVFPIENHAQTSKSIRNSKSKLLQSTLAPTSLSPISATNFIHELPFIYIHKACPINKAQDLATLPSVASPPPLFYPIQAREGA